MDNISDKIFLEREKVIRLVRLYDVVDYIDEYHFINDLIATYKRLLNIVVPLIAEIDIEGCGKRNHEYKTEYQVEKNSWRLKCAEIPEYITPRYHSGDTIEQEGRMDTIENLEKWVGKCIDQPSLDPDKYLATWSYLCFKASKAKIPNDFNQSLIQVLDEDNYKFSMKIEEEKGSKWLFGPIKECGILPPIQIEFFKEHWAMDLRMTISNSIWFENGSKGRDMVVDVVKEIMALGWECTYASEEFNPEITAAENES